MFQKGYNYQPYTDYDLLSIEEKVFLEYKIDNFSSDTSLSDSNNFYYRQYADSDSDKQSLSNFLYKVYSYLNKIYDYPVIKENGIWINKIADTDSQSDIFHRDKLRFSSVTFLNDDFEGGYFAYLCPESDEVKTIKPEKFKTIIFDGNAVKHRVNKVTKGTRYSLVSFWEVIDKKNKTMI